MQDDVKYKTIGLKPFLEMLDAMGYEIIVREKDGKGEYPIRLTDYQ